MPAASLVCMRWLVLAGGLALLGFCAAAWLVDREGVVASPLDWSEPTALVVLGARVDPDGSASTTLAARVAHAVLVARDGKPALFIVSGGVGNHGPAEADVGLALARQLGLEGVATVPEAASHTTHENAVKTAQLLRERRIRRVVVVSDPYHLPRARLEFEQQHLRVQTSPVLTAPRHQGWLARVWWTSRELVALVRFHLRHLRQPTEGQHRQQHSRVRARPAHAANSNT